ncbi:putative PiggyBac transposable element-derived protein 4-like 24 [Homarus americanus]|uniref:Putative PiggyBac transposable element-derived protein 4-like 24 n=1 Tax=Homarus americanus TaxID=6706 RepID=A0A8J5NBK8_HOMAM|nr:putative PiggyBac transposable element-derived protein 4-like 24 [Homarus americanus]
MHSQPTIDTNGKPKIINYYNKTKGAVDMFDKMCSMYSCSCKTRTCLFHGIVNAATINSWIIYSKNREGQQVKRQERCLFMQDLALQLVTPWAQKRLNTPSLKRNTKQVIANLLQVTAPIPTFAPALPVKKRQEHDLVLRSQIARLHEEGLSISSIARRLGISRPTAQKWTRRWQKTGNLKDLERKPRRRVTSAEEDENIRKAAEGDHFTNAAAIKRELGLGVIKQEEMNIEQIGGGPLPNTLGSTMSLELTVCNSVVETYASHPVNEAGDPIMDVKIYVEDKLNPSPAPLLLCVLIPYVHLLVTSLTTPLPFRLSLTLTLFLTQAVHSLPSLSVPLTSPGTPVTSSSPFTRSFMTPKSVVPSRRGKRECVDDYATCQQRLEDDLNMRMKIMKEAQDVQVREFEAKVEEHEARTKEHEARMKEHEARMKEHEVQMKEHEARMKEHELHIMSTGVTDLLR